MYHCSCQYHTAASQVFQPDPLSLTPGTTGDAGLILNFSCCEPGTDHSSLFLLCVCEGCGGVTFLHIHIGGYCMAHACETTGSYTRRAQSRMSGVFPHHYCLKTGSLTELKVCHWLASELLRFACLCLPSATATAICVYALVFFLNVRPGGLNSDPQACYASTLTH